MDLFGIKKRKEKKAKLAAEAAIAKRDEELQAIHQAKQAKAKMEKKLVEMDQTIQNLIAEAASAKSTDNAEVYSQCVSLIGITRARKQQAQTFIHQINTMLTMQDLAADSDDILGSINGVMSSLGKFSLSADSMKGVIGDMGKAQSRMDKESANIDSYLSQLASVLPEGGNTTGMYSMANADIEAEIAGFMANGGGNKSGSSELDEFKKFT